MDSKIGPKIGTRNRLKMNPMIPKSPKITQNGPTSQIKSKSIQKGFKIGTPNISKKRWKVNQTNILLHISVDPQNNQIWLRHLVASLHLWKVDG